MSLSACSRRVSGRVRPRAVSVTTSAGHPLALSTSSTIPSLDSLSHDLIATRTIVEDRALGARTGLDMLTAAGNRKASALATLGRPPPTRRPLLTHAECIAENTFRRNPSAGLLWRPFGLGLCSSTSMSALANTSFSPHTGPPLASTEHGHSLGSSGYSGSLLLGLAEPQAQGLAQTDRDTQAQAQTHAHSRTARVLSLAVLSPLAPTFPGDTLDPCAHQPRINSRDDPAATSPVSSFLMPSATSSRSCSMSMSRTPSAMKSTMPPPPVPVPVPVPMPIPSSSANASLLPSSSACSSPMLSPVLPCLPSASALHSPAGAAPGLSPQAGLAPPAPYPSAFIPESPIAHARRAPSPARTPPMRLHSTPSQHTLAVLLPEGLAPEMVTISAKKGARLAVVADLWHRENDSHYEWEVVFSPADVDMMSVRAVFEVNGQLMIHVRRRPGGDGLPPPLICAQ